MKSRNHVIIKMNFNSKILIQKVFSGSLDSIIKLWELESCECIKTFIGHQDSVTCIKNVLNDKLISEDATGVIKIWRIETGNV